MKALPDIKTANKVVELVLKNASIAVTGIWQADDDGVLNPATVELVPGTIIPKAGGSSGLTPLETPGRFDVSEIVLESLLGRTDLRAYDNGAARLRNVFVQPTGGLKCRPGLRHLATLPGPGRLVAFDFNTEQAYVLAFTDRRMTVFRDGVAVASVAQPAARPHRLGAECRYHAGRSSGRRTAQDHPYIGHPVDDHAVALRRTVRSPPVAPP